MKKIALIIALAWATPAQAQDTSMCPAIGDMAETLMKIRQAEGSFQITWEHFDKMERDGDKFAWFYKKILIRAYDQPKFMTEAYKQQAVAEFRNAWVKACYKVMSEPKGEKW